MCWTRLGGEEVDLLAALLELAGCEFKGKQGQGEREGVGLSIFLTTFVEPDLRFCHNVVEP